MNCNEIAYYDEPNAGEVSGCGCEQTLLCCHHCDECYGFDKHQGYQTHNCVGATDEKLDILTNKLEILEQQMIKLLTVD